MTEMTDRARAAAYKAMHDKLVELRVDIGELTKQTTSGQIDEILDVTVRAALAELRELTQAMIEAAQEQFRGADALIISTIWQVMLDAALK